MLSSHRYIGIYLYEAEIDAKTWKLRTWRPSCHDSLIYKVSNLQTDAIYNGTTQIQTDVRVKIVNQISIKYLFDADSFIICNLKMDLDIAIKSILPSSVLNSISYFPFWMGNDKSSKIQTSFVIFQQTIIKPTLIYQSSSTFSYYRSAPIFSLILQCLKPEFPAPVRFLVLCLTCNFIVHPTPQTGPLNQHARDWHNIWRNNGQLGLTWIEGARGTTSVQH